MRSKLMRDIYTAPDIYEPYIIKFETITGELNLALASIQEMKELKRKAKKNGLWYSKQYIMKSVKT